MKSLAEIRQLAEESVAALQFPDEPRNLYDPLRYMMNIGGKRLRPVLAMLSCQLCGAKAEQALPAALALEVFHNFTLVHDDIMDRAPLRRGFPTVHTKWNEHIAILSGDVLFVQSLQLINRLAPEVQAKTLSVFLKAAAEVCEGQQLDMDFEQRNDVTTADYLEMIRLKTAVLLGASLAMGAIIAGADEEQVKHLEALGTGLGVAFQLQDDLMDVFSDDASFGKQAGGDILSNKKTFLLLSALARPELSRQLQPWLELSPGDTAYARKVEEVTRIYREGGVDRETRELMNQLYHDALKHLEALPFEEHGKELLRELAEMLRNRKH